MAVVGALATPVRAVLLDAGNTLLRVKTSVGQVYAAVAGRFGPTPPPAVLDQHFHAVFAEMRPGFLAGPSRPHDLACEKRWWRRLVAEVFTRAGGLEALAQDFSAFFDQLYAEFERPDHWQIYPDVMPSLARLRQHGMALAVVSNWDSRLHTLLHGLGLADAFAFVLTSAEFGAEKPHPSIFREAVARLQLEPAQVLHVGDLLEEDVRGARAAGLQALWLRRGPSGPCPAGVRCVPGLAEVAATVTGAANP